MDLFFPLKKRLFLSKKETKSTVRARIKSIKRKRGENPIVRKGEKNSREGEKISREREREVSKMSGKYLIPKPTKCYVNKERTTTSLPLIFFRIV